MSAALIVTQDERRRQRYRVTAQHPRLVHHYESAEDLTTACRYDEALSHCFSALELDPKNVDIRLQRALSRRS